MHNFLFFLPLLPITLKHPPHPPLTLGFLLSVVISGTHEASTQSAISLHYFSLVLPISPVYLTSFYSCLVHQQGIFSSLHFYFTQTVFLDFFSLPAMHSRRVLQLQKAILLEVLQAQVLEDKKPPQLIVLSNCNGAAMAKNNTNQETSIGNSILL